jgi:hypothetical protein
MPGAPCVMVAHSSSTARGGGIEMAVIGVTLPHAIA